MTSRPDSETPPPKERGFFFTILPFLIYLASRPDSKTQKERVFFFYNLHIVYILGTYTNLSLVDKQGESLIESNISEQPFGKIVSKELSGNLDLIRLAKADGKVSGHLEKDGKPSPR